MPPGSFQMLAQGETGHFVKEFPLAAPPGSAGPGEQRQACSLPFENFLVPRICEDNEVVTLYPLILGIWFSAAVTGTN